MKEIRRYTFGISKFIGGLRMGSLMRFAVGWCAKYGRGHRGRKRAEKKKGREGKKLTEVGRRNSKVINR